MAIDYESQRENRRISVVQPKQNVETRNADWQNYRSGERDSKPAPVVPAPIPKQTDWIEYRAGERGDPVIPVKKPDEVIITSFSAPTIIPTVPAVPITLPTPLPPAPTTYKVKVATPEIILFDDDSVPVEVLTDLIFENIGGQELLSMSRHDTVDGDYVSNQLIKNLTSLKQDFSSKRLLSLQNTSDKYFSNFGIKLENKIPFVGNGQDGSNVYLDESQNIIIELVNLDIDEQVEVQLGIGGTIYTIVLGATE